MGQVRRFGPVKGPGVAIVEREPEEQIEASSTGVIALVGKFERGEVNTAASPKLNECPTKGLYARIMGKRITASSAPDVADDFWSLGQGAGEIIAIRVADGDELTSEITFYSRKWGADFHAAQADKGNETQLKRPVLKIAAKNAGAWGGPRRSAVGEMANVAAELTETTLDTKIATFKKNELTGATLTLKEVGFRTYKVVSNTTAGIVTVETGSTMLTDATAGAANKKWTIQLDAGTVINGTDRKTLAIRIIEGSDDPLNTFGMEVYVDGALADKFDTLSMVPTSKYYVEKVINAKDRSREIVATDLWAATGEAVDADTRPADFHGRVSAVDGTTLTLEPAQVVSLGDAAMLVAGLKLPSAPKLVPHRLTFTWVLANTKYTVVASDSSVPGIDLTDLPDFVVGAGEQTNKVYTPGFDYTLGITLDHTGAVADGKTIVIDVLPLDALVAPGGTLIPDHTKPLKRLRIKSTTQDTITVESGDPSALTTASTNGSVKSTNAGPYVITVTVDDEMLLSVDGRKDVAVTLTPGAARTATQVVADIQAAFDAIFGAGVLTPATVESDQKITFASQGGLSGGGPGATIEIKAVATDAYTILGLVAAKTKGTAGKEATVSYESEPHAGFDGGAPSDQKFLDALSVADTPLKLLAEKEKGVIQLACPGITSTAVQKQLIVLAEAMNHHAEILFPVGILDEQAAIDYIDTTIGRSDFAASYLPSFVDVPDPDKDGEVTKEIPVTGMILGRDALYARRFLGYSRPAAGTATTLPRIVDLPTGDTVLNEELLTPRGINVIKKKRGNFIIWGARNVNTTSAFRWKAHRLQLSHYEHTFQASFDWVIFALNQSGLHKQLISQFRGFFGQEFANGVLGGVDAEDAVTVKIDDENNTAIEAAAGNLHAEIGIKLPEIVERFIITVGKQGIFEGTSA